jgi:tetratricopeptide (TPR) repeat protein
MAAKSKSVKRPARKKAPPRRAAAESEARAEKTFPLEVDPKRIEETFAKLKGELVHWANKSRYTRVRFKFRGKQLLPDLPLAAVMAAEGLTFYWGGILRTLIFNIAGKTVFDVELVNDSEKRVQQGKEALLTGDLDKALEHFRAAIAMERDNAQAHLNVGVALKLKGDPEGARISLEKAKSLDPDGPLAAEADKVLMQMKPPGTEPAPLMRIR